MDNDLDDLDFDVDEVNNPSGVVEPTPVVDRQNTEIADTDTDTTDDDSTTLEDTDLLTDLLRAKGIVDPKAIKFTDDEGNITEHDFNSLSREEQLEILNSSDSDNDDELTPDELSIIKFIRDNNLTIDQYNQYIGRHLH